MTSPYESIPYRPDSVVAAMHAGDCERDVHASECDCQPAPPPGLYLRVVRQAVRAALNHGVTPVEIIDAAAREVYHPAPQSLEELGLTHPDWGQGADHEYDAEYTDDEKRAELRARLARHDREALSPGGRPRG